MNYEEKFKEISDQIENGRTPSETVRTLLSWFDAQRRGYWIVREIRTALSSAQLQTEPDFEGAYIDLPVRFVRAEARSTPSSGQQRAPANSSTSDSIHSTSSVIQPQDTTNRGVDPTYRIGKLPSANQQVVSVRPDSPLTEATTLMLTNDFSQVPVMTSEREVKGMISWKSIGQRLSLGQQGQFAREFMDRVYEIEADVSLFFAIDLIVEHEYVLVRDSEKKICGIVTATDLNETFDQLGEPFLILGEIENHVRALINGKFSLEEIAEAADSKDAERSVKHVSDLTFGEYIRLLENPDRWNKLNLKVDRRKFVDELEKIRRIRNDVMHFDPDGMAENDLDTLRRFDKFLQRLQEVQA